MKVHVVHIHPQQPRIVLQTGDRYVLVESQSRAAICDTDEISGDLSLPNVKWLLNLTRSSLVNIKVLGRYLALEAAQEAALLIEPAAAAIVPANLARHVNRNPMDSGAQTEIRERSAAAQRSAVERLREGVAQPPQSYLARDARRPRQEAASR